MFSNNSASAHMFGLVEFRHSASSPFHVLCGGNEKVPEDLGVDCCEGVFGGL